MMNAIVNDDPDAMSDEDFLNLVPGEFPAVQEAQEEGSLAQPGAILENVLDGVQEAAGEDDDDPDPADPDDDDDGVTAAAENHTTPIQTEANNASDPNAPAAAASAGETEPLDYEALFKQVMAPFRANGREFAPASPEEAVQLMQLGANYTKKMQALKPNLKMLRMLENNNLLNEDRINFLIDLERKDPSAIQKLLHDAKVDPLDLDTTATPTYKPGNHTVSDAEMNFTSAIEEVTQTATGKATIHHIDKEWDQASKEAIYNDPSVLRVIDSQRANGIYDRISNEIERRKTLGQLPEIPFLQAYKLVGDELHAKGQLVQSGTSVPAAQTTPARTMPQPLETRTQKPRKPMATREQVHALSSVPGSPNKSTKASFNPLTMSDEEIMAIPQNF